MFINEIIQHRIDFLYDLCFSTHSKRLCMMYCHKRQCVL